MYKGEIKNEKDVAIILQQESLKNWLEPVRISVSKLDGETLNGWPSEPIHVDPGNHELELYAMHDHVQPLEPPVLKVSVKAGQVYQLDYRLTRYPGCCARAVYWLRHIGNHKDYEDYLARNPEYKVGTPLFIPSAD